MNGFEIELSGGRKIVLREPGLADLSLFLRATPGLQAYWDAYGAMGQAEAGVILPVPELPEVLMAPVWELASRLSGLSLEELMGLNVGDGMAILAGLTEFTTANFTQRPRTSLSPAGAPA